MSSEDRRYDEAEIREIMELAAREEAGPGPDAGLPAAPDARHGLTLAELQAIGREVGLDPDRIADAAGRLELRRSAVADTSALGLPIAVGRAALLPRPLTDDEWSILVSEIRETFGARGRLSDHGALREWSNGNLHVAHEPTDDGWRLRLHTRKETAITADRIGITLLTFAVILFGVMALVGGIDTDLFAPFFLGALGVAAQGYNLLVLPRWSRQRAAQMEHIAARALELASGDDAAEPEPTPPDAAGEPGPPGPERPDSPPPGASR